MKIIESVPNFSEGRNRASIEAIAEAVRSVEGVALMNVDPGVATNRTVFTFAGESDLVCEAAFRAVKRASELIDMRQHRGEHPRMGATDVLPLVPISGVTLEECADMARSLARRISDELSIPTYNYEAAASSPERRRLEAVRAGEYESLPTKLVDPQWKPDFGRAEYTLQAARSGATIVGARNFLIAVNFNLDTDSVALARAIAGDVRESGRVVDIRQTQTGAVLGSKLRVPGTLVGCKAIGWYIEEYGIAQVSMNITDIDKTPLHVAFEEVARAATLRGCSVTGTEIIGMLPKRVLCQAGEYFGVEANDGDTRKIDVAISAMRLGDLGEFDPQKRIIEYVISADKING